MKATTHWVAALLPHHVELRATGYQIMTFDVNIQAGKTITYRTPMQPVS